MGVSINEAPIDFIDCGADHSIFFAAYAFMSKPFPFKTGSLAMISKF